MHTACRSTTVAAAAAAPPVAAAARQWTGGQLIGKAAATVSRQVYRLPPIEQLTV